MAPVFVEWLGVPGRGRWLDVGCGTGALIQSILDGGSPTEVVGVDPSSPYIAYAREQIRDARVRFEVGTAQSLPVASNQYDAVVSGLVIQHLPALDRRSAIQESLRAARTGGLVGGYVWDYQDGMEIRRRFWEAASAVHPIESDIDERTRYPICQPDLLEHLFVRAGLNAVEVAPLVITARFADFDDYWQPFLSGYGVASTYLLGLESSEQVKIRARLQQDVPTASDGSIVLPVRAWGVKGIG